MTVLRSLVGRNSSVGTATTLWAGRSGGSNPGGGGGQIFLTRPGRPWGPPSLLYNLYRIFPGGKAVGAWALITHPQTAPRLKEE